MAFEDTSVKTCLWQGQFKGEMYGLVSASPEDIQAIYRQDGNIYLRADDFNQHFVLNNPAEPVGFFGLRDLWDYTEVSWIWVRDAEHNSFRGKGLGRMMVYLSALQVIESDADVLRYVAMHINVYKTLDNLGFRGRPNATRDFRIDLTSRDFQKRRFQSALDQILD